LKNAKDGYLLHQKKHTKNILKRFNIEKYIPLSNMIPVEKWRNEKENKNLVQTDIEKAIRSLIYLAISTRPDILFAVK